ncbi:hypothetical protein SAMN02799624_05253 [Paenibacillus sp. UNC496MF]|nr:hypothetical protein SAMN02799624_05253 [Paenibacillus sp. UNC496MF]
MQAKACIVLLLQPFSVWRRSILELIESYLAFIPGELYYFVCDNIAYRAVYVNSFDENDGVPCGLHHRFSPCLQFDVGQDYMIGKQSVMFFLTFQLQQCYMVSRPNEWEPYIKRLYGRYG